MAKAGIEFCCPDRVRAERFQLSSEGFVQSLDDRHHENDCDHADADAQNGQQRAQLVCAHCVQRHQSRFFNVDKVHGWMPYSERSASIGSNFAARQAGHKPLITPTTEDIPTPSTADQMLKSN